MWCGCRGCLRVNLQQTDHENPPASRLENAEGGPTNTSSLHFCRGGTLTASPVICSRSFPPMLKHLKRSNGKSARPRDGTIREGNGPPNLLPVVYEASSLDGLSGRIRGVASEAALPRVRRQLSLLDDGCQRARRGDTADPQEHVPRLHPPCKAHEDARVGAQGGRHGSRDCLLILCADVRDGSQGETPICDLRGRQSNKESMSALRCSIARV